MYEIKYRKMEEMKDSGVRWLGEIPTEWNMKKINWLFREIGSGTTPNTSVYKYYDNGKINWLLTGDLNDSYIYKTSKKVTNFALRNISTLKIYPKDTLVIAMYGATIGKLGITDIETTTNQACCCFTKPLNIITKYIYYWFLGHRDNIVSMGYGGGQPNISKDLLINLRVSVGSNVEQQKITNFLDIKTSQFDSIISKKEKLIKKLEEAKKSLISEVVTGKVKIVDEEIVKRQPEEMKDSGVGWLGMIPKDWEINKLKYLVELRSEKVKANSTHEYIGMENIESWTGRYLPNNDENDIVEGISNSFNRGDVLFGKLRPYLAKCIVTNFNGICSSELLVLNAKKLSSKILQYILLDDGFINIVNGSTYGTKMPRANWDFVGNIKLPYMNSNHQIKITEYLGAKIYGIDNIINKNNTQIQKLKQAKQSLISEAVTGKIDLRDWEIIEEGEVQ